MLKLTIKLISTCFLISALLYTDGTAQTLSPNLAETIDNAQPDSVVRVLIILEDNFEVTEMNKAASQFELNRSDKIKSVISRLTSYQSLNKSNISDYLYNNTNSKIIEHWIIPAFTAELTVAKIKELSTLDGVALIVEDVQLSFEAPVKSEPAPLSAASVSTELAQINAPALWAQGLKGDGRLVCSFDTGVDGLHPALVSKWRGNHASKGESWFSKVAPDSIPYDATGHGTHTMGVMVGAAEADSFGVAPEAEWITAGVIDQGRSLSMTISDIIEAFQWALNPDGDTTTTDDVPDVILNSWGIPKGLFVPCDATFWGVIDNVEAAGIVTIFAAGNEGPEPMTLRSPADRASNALNAFSVGAVDINKTVASFSSRGPSSCDTSKIKPEIVAPGVSIRSSTKGGGYLYMSGTSMAAPYIAGSVALIRQYNPNATVAQIKSALIQSAQDLGSAGDDNAYGNGFIDLSTVLNYIPLPELPNFVITSVSLNGAPYALPGDTFNVTVSLSNPTGNVPVVSGTIQTLDKGNVIIENALSDFVFGPGGTFASNTIPYQIVFDSLFYHGQTVDFMMILSDGNSLALDTTYFTLTVGIIPEGTIATHGNSKLDVSVSDFGQIGFAPGSIYNLNGTGFRFNGSDNLLYESGLIIGRNSLQLSTSIRDAGGTLHPNDFSPLETLSDATQNTDGSVSRTAVYDDYNADITIPIEVSQESRHYTAYGEEGILIVSYQLTNKSIETLNGLHFGQLHDFDISTNDAIVYDPSLSMMYQMNATDMYVGVVNLIHINSFKMYENVSGKTGFTKSQLYNIISDTANLVDQNVSGDLMFISSTKAFSLSAGQSYEVAFAYVCGNSLNELYENAASAKEKYDIATDIDDGYSRNLPEKFILNQNYPNPFNPSTNISFQLSKNADIELEIFNILGKKVRTLYAGKLTVGSHSFEWDATDDNGQAVASGIYFSRLTDGAKAATQKMTLIK